MKLIEFVQELQQTHTYKSFIENHPDAFLTAGFFILNKKEKDTDSFQIDFFIPEKNNMASFEYPFTNVKIHEDEIKNQTQIKDLNLKIDIPNIPGIVQKETKKEYPKIIAVLQNSVWNITCLLGMDIKRLKIDAYSGKVSDKGDLKLTDIIQIRKASKE